MTKAKSKASSKPIPVDMDKLGDALRDIQSDSAVHKRPVPPISATETKPLGALNDNGLHQQTIDDILAIVDDKCACLERHMEQLGSLGATGRYRPPYFWKAGKAVFTITSLRDMGQEAGAALGQVRDELMMLGAKGKLAGKGGE